MDRILLPGTDLALSPLGMGTVPMVTRVPADERVDLVRAVRDLGINWFDTARRYGDAEDVLGEAFAGVRDQVVISSKSGARDPESLRLDIEESLRRLRTDYLDIFLFHGGGALRQECFLTSGGLLDTAQRARQAGKFRLLGFSAHSVELALRALDVPAFDVAMVPANFISVQYIEGPFMDIARDRGVTVLAMKPFGGGRLDNARLCLQYLQQYDGVLPCIGIQRLVEMQENVRVWQDPNPLGAGDWAEIERLRATLGDRFCRQCGYCLPCPQGVPIISMNLMEAWVKQLSRDALVDAFASGVERARGCVACRECVEKCPYDLPIPEMVADGVALYERTVAG